MAKIGTFKKVSGELRGEIATLTIKAKSVRIVPEAEVTGNNPTHRVFVGDVEIGAGSPIAAPVRRDGLFVPLSGS